MKELAPSELGPESTLPPPPSPENIQIQYGQPKGGSKSRKTLLKQPATLYAKMTVPLLLEAERKHALQIPALHPASKELGTSSYLILSISL